MWNPWLRYPLLFSSPLQVIIIKFSHPPLFFFCCSISLLSAMPITCNWVLKTCHILLKQYLHWFKCAESPPCEDCKQANGTIKHNLQECLTYDSIPSSKRQFTENWNPSQKSYQIQKCYTSVQIHNRHAEQYGNLSHSNPDHS